MPSHDRTEERRAFRGEAGEGLIVFDPRAWPQTPTPEVFDPAHWGDRARPVGSGGRGAAWFVESPGLPMVLRHYLRGGWMARISRDQYLWRDEPSVRSIAEFRLLQVLHARGLPVPRPLAAAYWRQGARYRAAILIERLPGVRSLGERLAEDAPWEAAGELVARFHRVGLDHADLNAHNLLFDVGGRGWMIDFDRGRLRAPAAAWQRANLSRLRRSLAKIGGAERRGVVVEGIRRLESAWQAAMERA